MSKSVEIKYTLIGIKGLAANYLAEVSIGKDGKSLKTSTTVDINHFDQGSVDELIEKKIKEYLSATNTSFLDDSVVFSTKEATLTFTDKN